jgi:hypothetical protein
MGPVFALVAQVLALDSVQNLSFPGNVRADELLSNLQIQFDIGESLFQGFVFVWHIFVPI